MYKVIEVKGHSALAKKVNEYKRLGYDITFKEDGKRYCLRKGIRQVVEIVRQ